MAHFGWLSVTFSSTFTNTFMMSTAPIFLIDLQ
jgi:hypothetical protein